MATLFAQLVVIPRTAMSVRGLLTMGIIVTMLGIALLLLPMSSGLFVFALTLKGFGMGLMRPAVAAGGSLAVNPDEQGAVAGLNSSTAAVGIIFVPIIAMPLYLVLPTGPFWIALALTGMMLFLTRSPALDALEEPLDVEEIEEETLSTPARH
jgi:MFS family permease